ncbi:hypothetical protein KEF85_04435 [Methylomonas paludis]|uniref:GPI inositol-deacylase PGAP1-like alpha/beta domain-containing protein n=1 Tax=Methylomonas paludis TaxID=1173101 RepID=A0A975MPN7_9GAMM|nr:hypothetical protein [Methylomonas paludis]QWF71731.1 hypothetical protein KEF85_04435 [Methylomonas paludis]
MAKNIVLAHGVLGFGGNGRLPIDYFNGVLGHLRRQGHQVLAPQVNPIGSVQQRAAQLTTAIKNAWPENQPVHIIAHSMGGLDARQALAADSQLAAQVKTLVTIGTPHQGSPVADAILNPTEPLFQHIPQIIRDWLQVNAGALHDLSSAAALQFNATVADVPNIRYLEVAGNAALAGHELLLFKLAAYIGDIYGEINDGVVTRQSALRPGHEHLPDWPVDHFGEIGWSFDAFLPFREPSHLARYRAIADIL